MKIVLTLQLQQDNGTPVLTGTQEKAAFVGNDYEQVRGFLVGPALSNLVKLMSWIADNRVSIQGTPTLTIQQL